MENRGRRSGVISALSCQEADRGLFTRERALDEHHLAFGAARDAAALGVERFDVQDQVFQSDRNSRQWGSGRFSSAARSRPHSDS